MDSLPDTEGKTVKLKLKWKSFNGEKTAEFDYCTRKSTPANNAAITAGRSVLRLKEGLITEVQFQSLLFYVV